MSKIDLGSAIKSAEEKFSVYRKLLQGLAQGSISHLFVRGAPGLGKSYEAEQILSAAVTKKACRFHRETGHITPLNLYNKMYDYRNHWILMFDDCDTAFDNDQCLNILKAGTDTRPKRTISWGSTGRKPVASSYVYEGSLLIITNKDLSTEKYKAVVDRVIYYELTLTAEEKVCRILTALRSKAKDPLFSPYIDQVSAWIIDNCADIGESISIRTAVKALELARFNRDHWQELAKSTLLQGVE